jgi:prevent-host-death family protein
MESIGVRELRQHASRYLARVASGETLEVTDRGRPIAMLVPVRGDEWQDLLASGRVVPPTADGDVLDEKPSDFSIDASGTLDALREDER